MDRRSPSPDPVGGVAGSILIHQIVIGESLKIRAEKAEAVRFRIETDRAMGCGGEAMPKSRLHEVRRKQLPYPFQ